MSNHLTDVIVVTRRLFSPGGVVIANNYNFVNSGFIRCICDGRPSIRIAILSTLACTNGLRGVGDVLNSHIRFIRNGVYSTRLLSGVIPNRSTVIRCTTRSRGSGSVTGPRPFLGAGIRNAFHLLRTTHGCSIHCRRIDASRMCNSLTLSSPTGFARRAPCRPSDPCDSAGTDSSLLIHT